MIKQYDLAFINFKIIEWINENADFVNKSTIFLSKKQVYS